ncbi:MAG: hypothetical protein AAGH79_03515 [Bacteroidota bacterium]
MAKSFIQIGDHGFWAQDRFIEAMQLCLIHEIEQQHLDSTSWVMDYKEALALESVPIMVGARSMRLEAFLTTPERNALILSLIDAIVEKIEIDAHYFTAENLYAFRRRALEILAASKTIQFANEQEFLAVLNRSRWQESPGISAVKGRYQQAFTLLRRLVNQELQTEVSSPINYWGF